MHLGLRPLRVRVGSELSPGWLRVDSLSRLRLLRPKLRFRVLLPRLSLSVVFSSRLRLLSFLDSFSISRILNSTREAVERIPIRVLGISPWLLIIMRSCGVSLE